MIYSNEVKYVHNIDGKKNRSQEGMEAVKTYEKKKVVNEDILWQKKKVKKVMFW